jgi:hypothetical protein
MPYVDSKGRSYAFGEFFPPELSAFAYNTSFAFTWYPKTREEVLEEGWQWQVPPERHYEITKTSADLPDHIKDVPDSITGEIIGCAHQGECNEQCSTAFRISQGELSFYRDMKIALPRLCSNCRQAERLQWRNGFTLHRRKCMCDGKQGYSNTRTHAHGSEPCPVEFETTFPPSKPEIIYCDTCYKAEFL